MIQKHSTHKIVSSLSLILILCKLLANIVIFDFPTHCRLKTSNWYIEERAIKGGLKITERYKLSLNEKAKKHQVFCKG